MRNRARRAGSLLVLLFLPAAAISAQAIPVIDVDLGARTFKASPPFDQTFAVRVPLPPRVEHISLRYGRADSSRSQFVGKVAALCKQPTGLSADKDAVFRISPLRPNTVYLFVFRLSPKPPARTGPVSTSAAPAAATTTPAAATATAAGALPVSASDTATTAAKAAVGPPPAMAGNACDSSAALTVTGAMPVGMLATPAPGADSLSDQKPEDVPMLVTAVADLKTHFDVDFGVLWAPRPGPAYAAAGSNVHFYFVPVNKSENRPYPNHPRRDQILKRVSVFGGLAFVKLHASEPVTQKYDLGNPVLGLGVRPRFAGRLGLIDFFRLNGGMVFFTQKNANPLISDQVSKRAPFVSLTGDIDLQGVLGPLAGLLGIKK